MNALKRICSAVFAAVLVLCSVGCAKEETDVYYTKPEGSGLDFWICEDVHDADFSGFSTLSGTIGSKQYVNGRYALGPIEPDGYRELPEKYVSYTVSAWPDYADGGEFVTQIVITDPSVKLFGVSVESTMEEFIAAMTKNGFDVREHNDDIGVAMRFAYSPDGKYYVSYIITHDIRRIVVNAPIENREGIVF